MSEQKKNQQKKLNIQLDEDVAAGVYSNLAIINHSATEFIADFVSVMPGMEKSKVKSRVILTPNHAKRLLNALNENIQRYEKAHGDIKEPEKQNIPMNFGPTGKA
ncbi:MAG: DUF3467 domain-containing protein [Psychroflexus sp.]|jgi:hypothetical protein|nr:DUF3467 domain-containing protein [Psychroflexus sp.]MDR9447817.1 DUF3467 domain-containing protein [Psychroflexus sp.]